jgi:hypothetical protein
MIEGTMKCYKCGKRSYDDNTCAAMEGWGSGSPTYLARYLEVITEMRADAHEAFLRCRREIGLPE